MGLVEGKNDGGRMTPPRSVTRHACLFSIDFCVRLVAPESRIGYSKKNFFLFLFFFLYFYLFWFSLVGSVSDAIEIRIEQCGTIL